MKKLLALSLALMIVFSANAFSQDFKGSMMAGGYLGYSLGFGDAFSDETIGGVDVSFGPGFNFGGTFHYGITEKILIGGELGLQSYKAEAGGFSSSETEVNILGTGLMALNADEDEGGLFLTGGAGIYGGFSSLGINGGIVYSFPVGETIKLFGMPRLHIVFDDGSPMILSISAGAFFEFGGGY